MANYTLVANSKFRPFSYQELAAPLDRQDAYHEKLMDEYDKLSSQADVLEAMGANDRDKNSKVYQQYKNYSDRLRAEADNLYRNGLNAESRMRLSDLRRMYNTDIVPIQNAWQKREKEAELQMKAQLDASSKGIDLYFSRNAADTPLQSYLDNPNQTFRTINGQALMNEVAAQFKGLANQLQEGKIKKEQLSPIEYRIITQKGMDYNEYMDFINNPNAPEFKNIRGIVSGTLAAHGAQDFDPTTQQRLFGIASQGVAAGVGSRDMQFHTDPYESKIFDYKLDIQKEREKAAIAAGGAGNLPFSIDQTELPIAIGDDNIDGFVDDNAKKFGLTKTKTPGFSGYNPGKIRIDTTNGYAGHFEVDLFDKSGKVKTWRQFMQDVNNTAGSKNMTTRDRERLKEQFEDIVGTAKSLGLNPQQGYTREDVQKALEAQRASGAAGYVRGYALEHKNDHWNPTTQSLRVREIKKKDHNGNFVFDSEIHTLGELLDTSTDAKINKNKQDVGAFVSDQDGQEGVIFSVGNRQFFMSKESIIHAHTSGAVAYNQIREGSNRLKQAEALKTKNPNEAYTKEQTARAIIADGLSKLDQALTRGDSSKERSLYVGSPTRSELKQ